MSEEKTTEISKQKEALLSMKNAKTNMDWVLQRNGNLEYALKSLIYDANEILKIIPENSYPHNSQKSHQASFREKINIARTTLSAE